MKGDRLNKGQENKVTSGEDKEKREQGKEGQGDNKTRQQFNFKRGKKGQRDKRTRRQENKGTNEQGDWPTKGKWDKGTIK